MFFLFDIGGTNTRVGISSDGKSLTITKIIPTPQDFNQGLESLRQSAYELSKDTKIAGVAGGIAGPLDKDKTMLIASSHLQKWVQRPLKNELEKVFNCQAFLENDAVVEGLGEATKGAGIGNNLVAYITIGTGVGGVRIVSGKMDENSLGFEPGHQIIVPDGNPCACGGKGHLEAYVAGSYFEGLYHQKGENITDPQIWDKISRYLAIGLVNSTVLWSPDLIVLGGSVSKSLPLNNVKSYFKEFLTVFPQAPEITLATLGNDAGLYGALTLLSKSRA